MRDVGIVIAHGADADAQRGPFLTQLAVHLAKRGHVVMRYFCRQKEQRRQRIFERSADTAAASPYARAVSKWVYVGHENGARIAALVGFKSARPKHGFIFLSYPLLEPAPPPPKQKAGADPPADSRGPLHRLVETVKAPELFICGELDYNCPGGELKAEGPRIAAAGVDARAVILPNLDAQFKAPGAETMAPETTTWIISLIDGFIDSVAAGAAPVADLPPLEAIVPSNRVPPRPTAPALVGEYDGEGEEMEAAPAPAAAAASLPPPAMLAAAAGGMGVALTPAQQVALAQHAHQINALQQLAMFQQMAAAQQAGLPPGAFLGAPQMPPPPPPGFQ
jgi:hypothetical protein